MLDSMKIDILCLCVFGPGIEFQDPSSSVSFSVSQL